MATTNTLEALVNTDWDVLIAGTGLQQSLLALALSRSGKKILHVDRNPYYSGAAAAFSIQEAEEWVTKVNRGHFNAAFAEASIYRAEAAESDPSPLSQARGRQYRLSLAPEILYTASAFRRYLISSQVHNGVEFLPVGSWWLWTSGNANGEPSTGNLQKVPNSREDLLGDNVLGFPAKRKLVKILRFILDYESDDEKAKWDEYRAAPFSTFLSAVFKAPTDLLAPLIALTISTKSPESITTECALPRIARHLRSTGVLGKFSALIPKYGGLDEFCQACTRACAIGGGVYVLEKGLSTSDGSVSVAQVAVEKPSLNQEKAAATVETDASAAEENLSTGDQVTLDEEPRAEESSAPADPKPVTHNEEKEFVSHLKVHLDGGEAVTAQWVVCEGSPQQADEPLCRSISIISSSLSTLFDSFEIDGKSFQSGAAVIIFPTGSLSIPGQPNENETLPPVHIHIHSSESGECPVGQSIMYASSTLCCENGFELLKQATSHLLASVDVSPPPEVIWSMQYIQRAMPSTEPLPTKDGASAHILNLTPAPLDVAINDDIFDPVREVWQTITGEDDERFLVFPARGADDEGSL